MIVPEEIVGFTTEVDEFGSEGHEEISWSKLRNSRESAVSLLSGGTRPTADPILCSTILSRRSGYIDDYHKNIFKK